MDLGSRCVATQRHVRGWTGQLRQSVDRFAPADVPECYQQHNVSLSLHLALGEFHVWNVRRDHCSAVARALDQHQPAARVCLKHEHLARRG